MELILLCILLAATKNGELKKSLREALDFYRENREIIAMAAEALRKKEAPPQTDSPSSCGQEDGKKEDRPLGEAGDKDLLEAYLQTLSRESRPKA